MRSRKVQAVSSLLGSQLGQAGDQVAALVDIGQAVKHRGGGMYLVVLIMPMRVEASNIGARAIVQGAAALGCRFAASVCGTSPPQAAPTSAALVVARKVRRLSSLVFEFLSMAILLEHEGFGT